MKSREQYKQELDALSERLKARGVVDVKFSTVPEPGMTFERVAEDLLELMSGILDDTIETTPFTGIGDSVRVCSSQQSPTG